MSEQLLAEVVKRLEYDVHCIDEWDTKQLDEITEQIAAVKNVAAQVAALTEQRDAARAALAEIEWIESSSPDSDEITWVCPSCWIVFDDYVAPELRGHTDSCQLAAAIAQGEAKE